ncbi:MAG: hypothetical protein ACUZ8I_14615 [Candidatus Scalindua sp.]
MINTSIKDEIINQVVKLPPESQRRVLEFAQALAISFPKGVKGKDLLRFEGAIHDEDLQLMLKAINENCEKVNINEW